MGQRNPGTWVRSRLAPTGELNKEALVSVNRKIRHDEMLRDIGRLVAENSGALKFST